MDARGKFGEHETSVFYESQELLEATLEVQATLEVRSRYGLEQLYLVECSPNFPRASITRYIHS